ncbi:MAG: hypothetical protein K6F26_01500 [Lachnospiraceae bacterium]|nr:hypothetical protein [Lachnospiraceae bacterium]
MERKKNRGSAIVGVIFVLALVGIGVGVFFFIRARKYDPGTFENNSYKNKWAAVQFTAPEGYTSGTQVQDGETLYYFTKGSNIVMIMTTDKDTDVDRGLEELKATLMGVSSTTQKLGVKMDVKDTSSKMIAGKSYKYVQISFGTGGITQYIDFYGRKVHGNGICIIAVSSNSLSGIDELISKFKKY